MNSMKQSQRGRLCPPTFGRDRNPPTQNAQAPLNHGNALLFHHFFIYKTALSD